jgi:high affinity sulfate transporter 1
MWHPSCNSIEVTDQSEVPTPLTHVELASILCILVGLFNLILGLCRLGFLDSVLSRIMLHGFIYGVGFVICIAQCVPLLGLTEMARGSLSADASSAETLIWLVGHVKYTHTLTAMVGFGCIVCLLSARFLKKRLSRRLKANWPLLIPEILLVIVGVILISAYFRLDEHGLAVLGEIPHAGEWPKVRWPPIHRLSWAQFRALATSAALIAVLGFVESIAVTKLYAAKHNYTVSANRDLVALGVANLAGGLLGAFPAFGSMARTKVSDKAGARTQLAGMITALCSLASALLLLPYLWYLPRAALAGVVFTAALGLITEAPRQLRFITRLHAWRDMSLLATSFLATVIISVEAGILFVVTASIILVIRHTSVPRVVALGRMKGTSDHYAPLTDLDPHQAELIDGVLIVRFEEDLYFANCGQLKDRLLRLEHHGDARAHPADLATLPPADQVIFDFAHVPKVDAVAAERLVEIVTAYKRRGLSIYVANLRRGGRVEKVFTRAGLIQLIGPDHFFDDINQVLEYLENRRRQ